MYFIIKDHFVTIFSNWYEHCIGDFIDIKVSVASDQLRDDFVTSQSSYRELCKTCLHLTTCNRCNEYDLPIVYCERYLSDSSSPFNSYIMPELKGLCKNCRNRYTCIIMKAEGGVWHCNDYQ